MASGFFALLDDIAVLMDDVAVMGKIATKKTAGILGDDLAVNAEKATGFVSSREIPVLWAITKGSFLNKIIILPVILLLNLFLPWLIKLVLIAGGFYLAYEGVEKIYHYFKPHQHKKKEEKSLTKEEILTLEKDKIKSAIITDFILSVEIIIIALSTVLESPILTQILVVSFVAIVATIGVYGIVGLIVRMDDFGYRILKKNSNKLIKGFGSFLINALPWVIKGLSFVGTIALLLVSGGIFVHNIEYIHHLNKWHISSTIFEFIIGIILGLLTLLVIEIIKKIRTKF